MKPAFVSVVETPRNLLSPVIPPATGFALVRRDGSVLYHSDHDRILNENLFRETENFRTLAEAVAMQSEGRVEGRYRGNNVAFYVRPIREVAGIPWTIVVFREIEQWQTLVWQVGLDVLVLYLLLWAVPVFAVPAALLSMKWRRKNSWNACRIAVLREFWPKAHAARCLSHRGGNRGRPGRGFSGLACLVRQSAGRSCRDRAADRRTAAARNRPLRVGVAGWPFAGTAARTGGGSGPRFPMAAGLCRGAVHHAVEQFRASRDRVLLPGVPDGDRRSIRGTGKAILPIAC